jgi:hypothetical protein
MNQDIFKTLQKLKRIEPDADYAKYSRMLVLAAPQSPIMDMSRSPKLSTIIRLSTILGVGLIGIFFILGGTSYLNETYSPLALEGLNQKSLVAEANEINSSIEITLGAIDYLDTSNQVTLKKITAISKTNASTTAVTTAALAPSVATTSMDAFLIDSSTSADRQINAVLDAVAK